MIQQTYTYVVPDCPVEPTDCVVSDWSDWSECIEGTETRTRTIITPAANGGAPCPTLTETRDCELTVDCVVSEWSEWSDCAEGNQTRTRTVITPASGGGVPCPLLEENRPCDLPCPPPTDLTATISE
jgi:complement component 6